MSEVVPLFELIDSFDSGTIDTHKTLDYFDEGEGYPAILHCEDCGATGDDGDWDSAIYRFTCDQYKAAHPKEPPGNYASAPIQIEPQDFEANRQIDGSPR